MRIKPCLSWVILNKMVYFQDLSWGQKFCGVPRIPSRFKIQNWIHVRGYIHCRYEKLRTLKYLQPILHTVSNKTVFHADWCAYKVPLLSYFVGLWGYFFRNGMSEGEGCQFMIKLPVFKKKNKYFCNKLIAVFSWGCTPRRCFFNELHSFTNALLCSDSSPVCCNIFHIIGQGLALILFAGDPVILSHKTWLVFRKKLCPWDKNWLDIF